jgi:peptidylprolyl isomerase
VRPLHRLLTIAVAGVLLAGAGACGGDDDDSAAPSDDASTSSTISDENVHICEEERPKPDVPVPDTKPAELVVEDLEPGQGAGVEEGDAVALKYVGVSFSTRQEFDDSWASGEPITLTLGAGNVIKGWEQGILGMKLCGRRLLVIPPELGYGDQASGPIAANETLVFVVDLVGIIT